MARWRGYAAGMLVCVGGCSATRVDGPPLAAKPMPGPANSVLRGIWGGPKWPTAPLACSNIDPATGEPLADANHIEVGWCVGSEIVRWSDGENSIVARSPIGMRFNASAGVADLGGGAIAVACYPLLIRWSDPPLLCILELHNEVGLLQVNRIIPVPSPAQASLQGLADWAVKREATTILLGRRTHNDLIVAFPDSLALVSLVEWSPLPPAVCSWGVDYCSDGVVIGNRLVEHIEQGEYLFDIELLCNSLMPDGSETSQSYCASCTLPVYGGRGEVRPAEAFEPGRCADAQ